MSSKAAPPTAIKEKKMYRDFFIINAVMEKKVFDCLSKSNSTWIHYSNLYRLYSFYTRPNKDIVYNDSSSTLKIYDNKFDSLLKAFFLLVFLSSTVMIY